MKHKRFLYLCRISPEVIKMGISVCPSKRMNSIKSSSKLDKKPEIIRMEKLPFQCARCAEFAFLWQFEWAWSDMEDYAHELMDSLPILLEGKRCKNMHNNKGGMSCFNKCKAFNGVKSMFDVSMERQRR